MDGSMPAPLSIDLEDLEGPVVLTAAHVNASSPAISSCLRRAGGVDSREPSVRRMGVAGESVTFRDRSQDGLHACDNSTGSREGGRRWCGGAYGLFRDEALRDPRLDLGCTTREGASLAFAWIDAEPGTRYVVVQQRGYAEVYETVAGLPVRVTTAAVELESSSATFDVSEHRSDGTLIREYRLEASVSG
jgi:hypothetical protein